VPDDDQGVARATAHYPAAEITPAEFEQFVVDLLESASPVVDSLRVTLHDKIQGTDGLYDFDATVRFRVGGIDFLVLVEAKRHKNPVKRELVQVLHDKLRSVGAQKRRRPTRAARWTTRRPTASRWPPSPKAASPTRPSLPTVPRP